MMHEIEYPMSLIMGYRSINTNLINSNIIMLLIVHCSCYLLLPAVLKLNT